MTSQPLLEYHLFSEYHPLRERTYFAIIYDDSKNRRLLLQRVPSPLTKQNQQRALEELVDKVYHHSLAYTSLGGKPRIKLVYDSSPQNGIIMKVRKVVLDGLPDWAEQYFGKALREKMQKRKSKTGGRAHTTTFYWALGPQGGVCDGPGSHDVKFKPETLKLLDKYLPVLQPKPRVQVNKRRG